MGAGRSGTTLLATLLSNNDHIRTLGEMHQFLDYLLDEKPCSCGSSLEDCSYWSDLVTWLRSEYTKDQLHAIKASHEKAERHSNIIKGLFSSPEDYLEFETRLFERLYGKYPGASLLDSSKYVARALHLHRLKSVNWKYIFLTRDSRGVINSFGKQVQTPKSPLGTIVYYALINYAAILAKFFLGSKRVIRLRYEDLLSDPRQFFQELSFFLNKDLSGIVDRLERQEPFEMPHIIAGNRMRSEQQIKLKPDLAWKNKQPRPVQILYYLANLPLQLIFKYPL